MRRTTLGATVLALLLTACSGEQDPGLMPGHESSGPGTTQPATQPASGPEPTTGHRYAGLGRVVVEVPDDWGTVVFDGCHVPPSGTVVFGQPRARRGCQEGLRTARSWLLLDEIDPGDSLLLAMRAGGQVDGERTRRTGVACLTADVTRCSASIAVPGQGVLAQVNVVGRRAEEQARTVIDSLRVLGEDAVAVPPIPYGTEDDRALAILDEAGLEGRIPEVDWPHYVTGSEPPAGTVVEVGATIGLTLGDG